MDSADRRSRSTGYKDIKLDDFNAIEDTQELNTSRKHKKTTSQPQQLPEIATTSTSLPSGTKNNASIEKSRTAINSPKTQKNGGISNLNGNNSLNSEGKRPTLHRKTFSEMLPKMEELKLKIEARAESNISDAELLEHVVANPALFSYHSFKKSGSRPYDKQSQPDNILYQHSRSSISKLEQKNIIENAPFLRFKLYQQSLFKKGVDIFKPTKKRTKAIQFNKTVCGKWPEVHSNKIHDMAMHDEIKAHDALFERDRLLVLQRLNLIISNPEWSLGEQLRTLFVTDRDERERKRVLESQWLFLIFFNQVYEKAEALYSKLKTEKGKALLDRIRIKKLIKYCKKRMQIKMANSGKDYKLERVLPMYPVVLIKTTFLREHYVEKARIVVGRCLAELARVKMILEAVDALSHLLRVAKQGELFHFIVKSRKSRIDSAWLSAKDEILSVDKRPFSKYMVNHLETRVLKFIYIYNSCAQLCGRMANVKTKNPSGEKRFSGNKLLSMMMKPEMIVVYELIIKCIEDKIEAVNNKEKLALLKKKGGFERASTRVAKGGKSRESGTQHTSLKVDPHSASPVAAGSRGVNPIDFQPFLPFSLSKHLDKNLMISIINAIIDNIPQIKKHGLNFTGFFG